MVMADTGTQSMNTRDYIESLLLQSIPDHGPPPHPHDWFAPLPTSEEIRSRRHPDVYHDPRYNHWWLSAADGDVECTAAPRRLPD